MKMINQINFGLIDNVKSLNPQKNGVPRFLNYVSNNLQINKTNINLGQK